MKLFFYLKIKQKKLKESRIKQQLQKTHYQSKSQIKYLQHIKCKKIKVNKNNSLTKL